MPVGRHGGSTTAELPRVIRDPAAGGSVNSPPRVSAALVLMGALSLGCDSQSRLTAPVESSGPSLRAEHFIHFNNFLMGGDPSNPLALQAGFDPGTTAEEVCDDPGGHGVTGEGPIVFTPHGGFHTHTSDRDASLVVYQFGGGPVTGPCQLVGAPVVATGTGKFTYKEGFSGRGAYVVHITVQGTVDLVTGGQARLWAGARVTIRPDGSLVRDDERVRLTPL